MKSAKEELLDMVQDIARMVDIYYVRQKEALGLGHAIYCARKFIGNEPFAVLLGDDVIHSEVPCLRQMMNHYERHGASIVGVQQVPLAETSKYGIVDGVEFGERLFRAHDLVEKPRPEDAPSTRLAIMGRYILNPVIFKILEKLPPGKGGEIQLTDGLRELVKQQEILAYEFDGRRYDVGDKLGFVQATIEYALRREDIAQDLKKYINELASNGSL